ncbi:hypothetical protein HAX54_009030, partial [Datura stramonium]|nr:hypothetical protein [Datura stramonium]
MNIIRVCRPVTAGEDGAMVASGKVRVREERGGRDERSTEALMVCFTSRRGEEERTVVGFGQSTGAVRERRAGGTFSSIKDNWRRERRRRWKRGLMVAEGRWRRRENGC